MPWMELLIVFGILLETIVLKLLADLRGIDPLIGLAAGGILLGIVLNLRWPEGRRDEELPQDIFLASALMMPISLALIVLGRWVWSH